MLQSFQLPSGQTWLIDRMKILFTNAEPRGICFGIAHMGLQAFFANDIHSFNRRLYYINQISVQEFNVSIRRLIEKRSGIIKKVKAQISPLSKESKTKLEDEPAVKTALDHLQHTIEQLIHENKIMEANRLTEYEKRKATLLENFYLQKEIEAAKLSLDERERLVLDIPIFLEGVELNHQGFNYNEFFEPGKAPSHQKSSATLPLTLSKSIEEQGGITQLTRFSGMYNENDLNIYFHTLAKTLAGTNASIAFELSSSDHTITVGYDSKNSNWVFIDANQLPAKENLDRKELASLVKNTFSKNNYCTFATTIYSKNSEKKLINQYLAAWQSHPFMQRIHTVTEEKAKTFDSDWVNWLYIASHSGDLAAVDKLLQLGADPNFKAVDFPPPLVIAAQYGHTNVVSKLLEKGTINHIDINNALKRAVQNGHLECIKELLKKGANRFVVNQRVETMFFIAALHGRLDILKELLKTNNVAENSYKTVYINMQSIDFATPLLAALKNGHTEIANFLISENADVNLADKYKNTPLSIAVQKGNLEMVNTLLQKGAKPNEAINDGATPLFIAAQKGYLEMVITLLNNGADPNQATNYTNITPLFIAAQNGRWDIVKALLAKGADCNMTWNNATPLLSATQNNHIKTVQVLLDLGADVNKQYSDGATPLLIATQNENLDLIKILLEKGAEVDKATVNKTTPLVRAVLQGRLDIVQMLLDRGANPNQCVENGDTISFVAFKQGRKDIYDALQKKGADVKELTTKIAKIQAEVKELFPNAMDKEISTWIKNYKSFLLLKQLKTTSAIEFINYNGDELRTILDFISTYLKSTPLNEEAKLNLLKSEQLFEILFFKKKIKSSEMTALFVAIFNENDAKVYERKRAEVFKLIHKHNPLKQKNIELMFEECMSNGNYDDALKILNLTDSCLSEDISASTIENFMNYTLSSRDNSTCEALFSQAGKWLTLDDIYDYIHGMQSSEQYMVQALKLALIILESTKVHSNLFADIFCEYPNINYEQGLLLDNLLDLLTPISFELLRKIASHPSPSKMVIDEINLAEILLDAAKKSNFDKNKLKNIKNVLAPTLERNYPPLILAIKEGNLSRVYELLETTDPNLIFKDDVTPLYYATQLGKVDIMRVLLEKGANVNATRKNGMTPLFVAASKGYLDAFQLLLDYDADPNSKRNDGLTPIFVVLQKNRLNMLEVLLSKNRDIQQAIEDGYIPLSTPINVNHVINDSGVTPLYTAIEIGDIEMIQVLLNTGADPNREVYDSTLLFKAIEIGRLDIVEALLDAKADPNKELFHLDPAKEDQTPITLAIRKNQLDILDALLKRNADPNKTQYNGKTPLEIALESKNVNIVQRLLNENIDNVDVILTTGLTALQTAVYAGQTDIVKMLLHKHANPYIAGPDGETALFYAAMQGDVEISKLILTTIKFDESQHAIKMSAEKLRSFVKKHDLVMPEDDLEQFIDAKKSSQTFFSPEFYVSPSEIANLTGYTDVRDLFTLSKMDQRKRKVSSNDETFQPKKMTKGGS